MVSRAFNSAYRGENLNRLAFPLGGTGAGMFCLNGEGGISQVSLRHRPDLNSAKTIFAAVSIKGKKPSAWMLEGPVSGVRIFGEFNTVNGNPDGVMGFPRYDSAEFTGRFPFGKVSLTDPDFSLPVKVTGWSPFIPGNADESSLPAAALEYEFENTGASAVEAVFSFHAANPIAVGKSGASVRRVENGFICEQAAINKDAPWEEGHFAAFIVGEKAAVDAAWFRGRWFDHYTMVWKSIAAGEVVDRAPHDDGQGSSLGGSLYVPLKLAPGEKRAVCVAVAWYVPVSDQWEPRYGDLPAPAPDGYYKPWYAARFKSIDEVVAHWRASYEELRGRTARFTDAFYDTTLPPEVVEAAAANLSILKSPTVLREEEGRLWAWEGCGEKGGSCWGSCTHVWNYAQALPHLFPSLERTLRETEFFVNQDESGHQNFRAHLRIAPPRHTAHAAADGQLGGVLKTYRDWRISGDTAWLRKLWPLLRRSLDYCIRTWDPEGKGVLVEPHHNTYDIEFWGPDSMTNTFYLAALNAAVVMGQALNDDVKGYARLLEQGRAFVERELFDGEYFIQKVQWKNLRAPNPAVLAEDKAAIAVGSYSPEAKVLLEKEGPKYQYGAGCLADGVLGEWLAMVSGLDPVLDTAKIRDHLLAVHRHNFKRDLSHHVNPQRPGFAIGHEGGLLLCTWPKGGEPSIPFVYSNEVWTGIEYQVAAHLIHLGCMEEGLEIVRACRARYDGRVRNPYSEYECGQWYARAMSSYSLLQACSGARYDAVTQILHLTPRVTGDFRAFLSTQGGFGTVGVKNGKPFLEVKAGAIPVREIRHSPRPASKG
jgi:uncharacterized protein (DUF608 family)